MDNKKLFVDLFFSYIANEFRYSLFLLSYPPVAFLLCVIDGPRKSNFTFLHMRKKSDYL